MWKLYDLIERFEPSFFQHPLSQRCTEWDCHRNVPLIFPGIPRTLAEHGRAICRKCFFTCVMCVPIVVDVSIVTVLSGIMFVVVKSKYKF